MVKTKKLEKAERYSILNAYVRVLYGGELLGESTVARMNVTPAWEDEPFSVVLQRRQGVKGKWLPEMSDRTCEDGNEASGAILQIQLWDKDQTTGEIDFLGQVRLCGEDLLKLPNDENVYFELGPDRSEGAPKRQRFTRGKVALSFNLNERGTLSPSDAELALGFLPIAALKRTIKDMQVERGLQQCVPGEEVAAATKTMWGRGSLPSPAPPHYLGVSISALAKKCIDEVPTALQEETAIWIQLGKLGEMQPTDLDVLWCGKKIKTLRKGDETVFLRVTIVNFRSHALGDHFLTIKHLQRRRGLLDDHSLSIPATLAEVGRDDDHDLACKSTTISLL